MSKKKEPLEPKQREYLKGRMAGKSKRQAAREAGYSEAMARKPGAKVETEPVKRAFAELLDEAGLTDELLAQRMKEGIDAEKANGGTDYRERREMAALALKLKGKLIEKHEVSGSMSITVVTGVPQPEGE